MVDNCRGRHHHSRVAVILTTVVFDQWFERLSDRTAAARVQARIDRAEAGNLGDCKPVGGGVSEMRIDHGPGYRVYFVQRGHKMIILLAGGEKSSRGKDIEAAKALAKQV
jgi:putative addiction module killer protein